MHQKLAFFPALLVAACVASAVYGALYNQVVYSVSHYHFTSSVFGHFRIPVEHWNRVGASLVGVYGSWWMGLVIGPPLLLVGLTIPGWKAYLRHSLIAFGVVAGTAMLVGLNGLVVARSESTNDVHWAKAMHECG